REILIDVKREGGFLRWEDDVLHMSEFEATSDQYVLAGLTGRYDRNEEIFLATGTADRPALLSRSGESAFSVTASEKIDIDFSEESLRAEGEVRYTSGEVEASCRLLIVDRRD